VLAGILANLVQIGPVFSFTPLQPKFERIHPMEGFKRVFSKRMLFEAFKTALKLVLFGTILCGFLLGMWPGLPAVATADSGTRLSWLAVEGQSLLFRLGLALLAVGWASGGGASQILFSLFGELVFHRGPSGIGYLWGSAGIGLLIGGTFAHWLGKRISFEGYKKTVSICYLIHGGSYIVFSQMPSFALAILFLGISRAAIAVSSVLNTGQLLRHVSDAFRGRVFATIETLTWSMMMLSMLGAGVASRSWSPRTIGLVAGVFSSSTAFFWLWANWTKRLPEPIRAGIEMDEVEVHGDPLV